MLQLLAERRRGTLPASATDQRTLLEGTARAMVASGCTAEALVLARKLGGGYGAHGDAAGHEATAESGAEGVRPCWAMLNVILESLLAAGNVQLQTVVGELLAAGTAQAKAAAAAATGQNSPAAAGPSGSLPGAAGLVLPQAVGRPRQGLVAEVVVALTEAGRAAEAVHLLRVMRGGENEESLLPLAPQALLAPPPKAAATSGRGVRTSQRTAAKRGRSAPIAPMDDVVFTGDSDAQGGAVAAAAGEDNGTSGAMTEGGVNGAAGARTQPRYNRLLLEGGAGDEEAAGLSLIHI